MTTTRKLKGITVSNLQEHIGMSLSYYEGPSEHVLLPRELALDLSTKLKQVYDQARVPGESVGVQEEVSMSIRNPKETLQ